MFYQTLIHDFTVDLLAQASNSSSPVPLLSDLAALEASLQQIAAMVDRVLTYVRSVLAGEAQGDVAVGRYLMDTLSTTTAGIEKGKLEGLFNVHLQVRIFPPLTLENCYNRVAGYPYGLIFGESGAVASRGIFATGTSKLRAALCTLLLCMLTKIMPNGPYVKA